MISEPMTLATDYLLAAAAAVMAALVLRRAGAEDSRRWWGIAFIALALGAALGGTHHGFRLEALWKPTLLALGVASAGMVAGSAVATTRGMGRLALLALAAAKLVLYWLWVWRDHRFIWAIADTGSAFVLVALLHTLRWRAPGSRSIVGGVALSIAAAAVQASGVDLHQHFNHNDLYHVVQLGALLAYYRGVRLLVDRR
ncbi:MAG TPA: hypothetical protein VE756_04105 [Burkholderiales bacterium]|nr:hypothetical protein [Burkholderiales bacterium]